MTEKKRFQLTYLHFFLLIGTGLLLRILFAISNNGFGNDTACFSTWADRMFTVGPSAFYTEDFFTDYPPGFMYILYVIGALRSFFQIPTYSGAHLLLLKLPAIICDIICSCLLFRESCNKLSHKASLWVTAAYLFNPAIILNSSIWGQVDSVFTLMIVCMCLALTKKRLLPAYISFGIGVLLKPQALVFTPVLLMGIWDSVFLQDFQKKRLFRNLAQGIGVILGMLLLCLPFGLDKVIAQYIETLGSYPYVSVNAYNFWGLLGLNWVSQNQTFFFLSYKQWGLIVILLIVLFTIIISLRKRNAAFKYPLLAAFIILTMFLFSVRMHERYMYPGLILLLLCCLYQPCKPMYFCYGMFSILHFCNTAHVLFYYNPESYNAKAPIIVLISGGMVLCILYFYNTLHQLLTQTVTLHQSQSSKRPPLLKGLPPLPSDKAHIFSGWDLLLLLTITILYSSFALYDLGDCTAPVTNYNMTQNDSILLDFGEGQRPATLSYYIAPWHDRSFTLESKEHTEDNWQIIGELHLANVFTWQNISLTDSNRYLKLTLTDTQASLLDFTFLDAEGNKMLPVNAVEYSTLFDENALHPTQSTFRNSMYFDEIYHGRTAYEFLQGLYSYENTHPPLGKIFIAIGIALFGMNPFGWRIIGTLFGIAMLPFIYLFGKRMTHNTPIAAFTCILFAFDFMHFVQTRIATIDVYVTFFIIVMYYFMYCYCKLSFYDTSLKRTLLPLGFCGFAMGLGFACKWTGVYAGLGLALLFFATTFRRYREYLYAKEHPEGFTCGISHAAILQKYIPYTKKTIGFCLIFFVALPTVLYLLSYLPFVNASQSGLLERMIQNQIAMLDYHSNLNATHPFSSSWYQWPLITRPVWYYSHIVAETAEMHLREGISAFGNPLVWWVGIPAFLHLLYLAIRNKDRTARFLMVGYLAQYLPWFFVTRIAFIYHYFPSVAFVVYMISYSLMQFKKILSNRAFYVCLTVYGVTVFALFLLFYPVLAGQPVDIEFVEKYLRWFEGWIFVAGSYH